MLNKISKISGLFIMTYVMTINMGLEHIPSKFMDMPSFYLITGILIGTALMTYGFGPVGIALKIAFTETKRLKKEQLRLVINTLNFYSQTCFAAGVAGSMIGLILMLYAMRDPSTLGPSMATTCITMLYAVCYSELFFQPLKNAVIRSHVDAHEDIKDDIEFNRNRRRWNWYFLGAGVITIFFLIMLIFIAEKLAV